MMPLLFAKVWLSTELQTSLIAILSMYDCREIPKQKNFKVLILEIAQHHFIRKPAATITDIHAGVPVQHAAFWSKMTGGMLYDVYVEQETERLIVPYHSVYSFVCMRMRRSRECVCLQRIVLRV